MSPSKNMFASLAEDTIEVRPQALSSLPEIIESSNIIKSDSSTNSDSDSSGFTTKKSRRPRLSAEAKATKAAEYQKEKAALIASGTAKKIDDDDQPQILNYGTNQRLANQEAAAMAVEEKKAEADAKHEKYLLQKAKNKQEKEDRLRRKRKARGEASLEDFLRR